VAKKKIIEPIVGTGRYPENKLMVQKSIPLFSLWQSDMSLAEFKILDTYLSRINSHEPEKRTVVFTKGELEQLLGIKKINKPQLAARLKSLGRFVDLEDGNTRKVHQVALFEEAYGEMDENGLWTVKLTCTTKAMKYIFNVEKLGYLRYKLHSIVSLKSRYAYVLFLYLEHNRFRKSWEVDVDVLRQFLNCDEDESYAAFKVFNDRILKRCQKELLEKTECRFEYEPVKVGRRVTAVRFTLESIAALPDPVPDSDQYSLFDEDEDPIDVCARVLPAGLRDEQILSLYMQAQPYVAALYGVDKPSAPQVAAYLQQKVALMTAYDGKDPIKQKQNYLSKMIANDLTRIDEVKKPARPTEDGLNLGRAELDAIARILSEPDEAPHTAGADPDLAARAEALRQELQS